MKTALAAAIVLASSALPADSASLKGRLVAANGAKTDFSDYVVWVQEGASLPVLPPAGRTPAMNQVNKQFSPRTATVRTDEKVRFENLDNVFHNVFSLDKRNKFDLGLYKGKKRFGEDKRTEVADAGAPLVAFKVPGKFAIYCNIHPDMAGTVYVFDHGYFGQADKDGVFELPVPASGTVTVAADGPRLPAPAERTVDLAAAPALLELSVSPKKFALKKPHTRKDGSDYDGPYRN